METTEWRRLAFGKEISLDSGFYGMAGNGLGNRCSIRLSYRRNLDNNRKLF